MRQVRDTRHRAVPGPSYWDWRCVRCGRHVNRHLRWWERIIQRISSSSRHH